MKVKLYYVKAEGGYEEVAYDQFPEGTASIAIMEPTIVAENSNGDVLERIDTSEDGSWLFVRFEA